MSEPLANLCSWLRANSSGIYRPSATAADMLEEQAATIARLEAELASAARMCDAYAAENQRISDERDAARREAMETCYQRVMAEGLDDPQLGTSDEAYEAAISQALGAIRAAMQEKP